VTLSLLLLLSSPANAWTHIYRVWQSDDIPRDWYLIHNLYLEDDSITWELIEPELLNSYQNWVDSCPCADLRTEYKGEIVGEGETSFLGGFLSDGISTHTFEDPNDELDDGAWAAAVNFPTGDIAFSRGGHSYYETYDADIVYNNHSDWISTSEMDERACANEVHLESVATHEIGHTWGMGHSCEEGDPCDEADKADATMFWAVGTCEAGQVNQTQDDIDGMYAMYGPSCQFEAAAGSDRFGGAPLDLCYDVVCTAEPLSVTWSMGDGTEITDTAFADMEMSKASDGQISYSFSQCHTYETKGQFSVGMDVTGEDPDCGTWESDSTERAYVLVCGKPTPAADFDGLFTYEHHDGLIYQMINQTDTTVYGCIDRIQWDVFQGETLIKSVSAWSPKIEFPEEGEYKVVLNVGGPGGITAGELTIDAEDKPGEDMGGCQAAPAAAGLSGLLLGLAGLARRRRE